MLLPFNHQHLEFYRELILDIMTLFQVSLQVMNILRLVNGIKLLEIYSENCLEEMQNDKNREKVLKELIGTLEGYMKLGG